MKIKLCPICRRQILKNQDITVIIKNLKSSSNYGEYYIDNSFFENETIYHKSCILENANFKIENKNINKVIDEKLISSLMNILENIGENPRVDELERFLSESNGVNEISDLITLWFKEKEYV